MATAAKQEMDDYVASYFDVGDETPDAGARPPSPVTHLEAPKAADHKNELRDITSIAAVMNRVANGVTWDARKLEKFFEYCAEEASQADAERENYYHVITEAGRCVGIVGIHPINYDRKVRGKPFLTIFLSPLVSGRGVGSQSIAAALADYWTRHPARTVYVDIRADNFPMLRVAEKLGLGKVGINKIGKNHYLRFAAERR